MGKLGKVFEELLGRWAAEPLWNGIESGLYLNPEGSELEGLGVEDFSPRPAPPPPQGG